MTPTDSKTIDLKTRLPASSQRSKRFEVFFDLDHKTAELESINARLASPEVWQDQKLSQSLQQKKKLLEKDLQFFKRILGQKEELEVLVELAAEGENVDADAATAIDRLETALQEAELRALFFDADDAAQRLHEHPPRRRRHRVPGLGRDAPAHVPALRRAQGLQGRDRRQAAGRRSGLKSVTMRLEGEYAYGYLKAESGVHRLVRISPFDANKRRHTSFAAVFVYPEVDDDIEIEIEPGRPAHRHLPLLGRGGQHVNRPTRPCASPTCRPTSWSSARTSAPSTRTRPSAMKMLKARLYDLESGKAASKMTPIEDAKSDIAWGNQIRSYVLHPYQMIKDHRTGSKRATPTASSTATSTNSSRPPWCGGKRAGPRRAPSVRRRSVEDVGFAEPLDDPPDLEKHKLPPGEHGPDLLVRKQIPDRLPNWPSERSRPL